MTTAPGALLVKVGAKGPGDSRYWQDGDIISALSPWRIALTHAAHICLPRWSDGRRLVDRHGLRFDPCGLTRVLLEQTSRYRFDRLSRHEVRRTNLLTGETDRCTRIAEGDRYLDVAQYVKRRRYRARQTPRGQVVDVVSGAKPLLGRLGRETWYDQEIGVCTDAKLDRIWAAIERETPLRRADHTAWPMGAGDSRRHLLLTTTPFSQVTAHVLEESRHGVRRLSRVRYRELLTAAELADVLDPAVPVRLDRVFDVLAIVEAKPPATYHSSYLPLRLERDQARAREELAALDRRWREELAA